ncbi:hypothetical protein [Chryseobacterium sediminis]|uniref:Uncharacterized protein n=1 Tax=Chryseobacterium sediminis TaxID=1679494 RepID=A0A5B2TP27_9FLAO|nr:hypothetical protein [Chryseobacterium sediminis]KAA2215695.1 hypothetical protein FW780_21510 [Chryseobacterium sediminis]
MKKNIILTALLSSVLAFSQVGIDTTNPQAKFHVDGAKDNPVTGVPTTTQQLNDFTVTSDGLVGIGTTVPNAPLTFPRTTGKKISLFNSPLSPSNDHEYNGFGMELGHLINQISGTTGDFTWRAGTSPTTSNILMVLNGNGNLGLGTGTVAAANLLTVNGGKFQYTDGTQGVNNLLVSDANGVASWKAIALNFNFASLGAGASIPANNGTNFTYTTSFVDLPVGKWIVTPTMLLTKGGSTGATETWWVRTTFSDNPANVTLATCASGDIVTTNKYISGLLPSSSSYSMLNGFVIINNTSGATKRYYYMAGYVDTNGTGSLQGFGGFSWGENNISFQRIN